MQQKCMLLFCDCIVCMEQKPVKVTMNSTKKKKNESKREPRIQVHVSLMMGFFFCVRKVRLYTID